MDSSISISDIRCKEKGVVNPLIVGFQNANVIKDVTGLKARLIPHDEIGGSMIEVLSENGQKFVDPIISSSLSNRFVAIRNKKSNKVKLIQVDFVHLINDLYLKETEKVENEVNVQEDVKTLKRMFGTKRAIKVLKQNEILNINKSLIEDQITEILADDKINEKPLMTVEKVDDFEFLPPCNREAKTVEEIYNINDCLSHEELSSLKSAANKILLSENDNAKCPDFFKAYVKSVCNSNGNNEMNICCLLYASALVTYIKVPAKNLGRIASSLCPYSNMISNKIVREFGIKTGSVICKNSHSFYTEGKNRCSLSWFEHDYQVQPDLSKKTCNTVGLKGQQRRSVFRAASEEPDCHDYALVNRPLAMKDKAICYVIILLAIACDFKVDLEILAKHSAYGLKKMKQLGRFVGLVPTSRNSNIYTLTLPLPPPLKMVKNYQKKK